MVQFQGCMWAGLAHRIQIELHVPSSVLQRQQEADAGRQLPAPLRGRRTARTVHERNGVAADAAEQRHDALLKSVFRGAAQPVACRIDLCGSRCCGVVPSGVALTTQRASVLITGTIYSRHRQIAMQAWQERGQVWPEQRRRVSVEAFERGKRRDGERLVSMSHGECQLSVSEIRSGGIGRHAVPDRQPPSPPQQSRPRPLPRSSTAAPAHLERVCNVLQSRGEEVQRRSQQRLERRREQFVLKAAAAVQEGQQEGAQDGVATHALGAPAAACHCVELHRSGVFLSEDAACSPCGRAWRPLEVAGRVSDVREDANELVEARDVWIPPRERDEVEEYDVCPREEQ